MTFNKHTQLYNFLIKISFTLYPAHRVGRGNLVLRHSVPHFPPNSGGIDCWWKSMPRFSSTPERRNGNINVNKYFIFSSGNRTHNQSILQSHFVPLRHDKPYHLLKLKELWNLYVEIYWIILNKYFWTT